MQSRLVLAVTHLSICSALIEQADVLEIRLDFFDANEFPALIQALHTYRKTTILTCRHQDDGGQFTDNELARIEHLRYFLSQYQADFLDLEHNIRIETFKSFHNDYPLTQIIRSYHHHESTPTNLDVILDEMRVPFIHHYKIVTTATSSIDNLRILHFLRKHSHSVNLTAHCMGELGQPSRILAKIFRSEFIFAAACETDTIAPGMIPIAQLLQCYRWNTLNSNTRIYGLIGNPIKASQGHEFHNALYTKHGDNAVYVKFQVSPDEVDAFLRLAYTLPIHGLSVTMPLKQHLTPHVFNPSFPRYPYNTLTHCETDGWLASNTDGDGALQAIKGWSEINNKKVLLLGAGGAAIAIAIALEKEGVKLTVANRRLENATHLQDFLEQQHPVLFLDSLSDSTTSLSFDLIINTLPGHVYDNWALPNRLLDSKPCVMDINYIPRDTPIVLQAYAKQCPVIAGWDMFIEQGLLQYRQWKTSLTK